MSIRRTVAAAGLAFAAVASSLVAPQVAGAATPYDVRIQVLDPAGRAVGAGVFVYDDTATHTGRTNARGRLTFAGAEFTHEPPRFCTHLDLTSQHLAGPTGWVQACADAAPPVGGEVAVTLRFTVGAALGGTVVDRRTAVGVGVYSAVGDSDGGGRSDADGRWVVPNLPPGGRSPLPVATDSSGDRSDAPYGYALVDLAPPGFRLRAGQIAETGGDLLSPLVEYDVVVRNGDTVVDAPSPVVVADVDGDPATPPDVSATGQSYAYGHNIVLKPWVAAPNRRICANSVGPVPGAADGLALRCVASDDTALTVTRTLILAPGGAVAGPVANPDRQSYAVSARVRLGGEDFTLRAIQARNAYTVYGLPAGVATVVVVPDDPDYAATTAPRVTVRADHVTRAPQIGVVHIP